MRTSVRRRLALSLLFLVPLGIGTKIYAGPAAGWVRGHAGGLLYVVFWIGVVATVLPHLSPWKTAGGVLFVTCLLEFLQLWHPPVLQTVRQTFIGRVLIGTTFAWWDFLHYGLGALLGALFVRGITRTAPEN